MASSNFGKFIEILFDKTSTPVQVLDAYKNLYSDTNSTTEQILNVSAGTTGLASAVTGYTAFYAEYMEGGATAQWLSKIALRFGALAGAANIGLLGNEILTGSSVKTNTAVNALAGGIAITALIPGVNVVVLGGLATVLTAGSLMHNDQATLLEDIAKLKSLLPSDATDAQKLQFAETLDAMTNHAPTAYSVPTIDTSTGEIIGYHTEEPLSITELGGGRTLYTFTNDMTLEQQSKSYYEVKDNEIISHVDIMGDSFYNNTWNIPTDLGTLQVQTNDIGGSLVTMQNASSGQSLSLKTDLSQNGYTTSLISGSSTLIERIGGTIDGQQIEATFTRDDNGNLQLTSIDSINGEAPRNAEDALTALKEAGLSPAILNGEGDATLVDTIAEAVSAYDVKNTSAVDELVDGIKTYGATVLDSLSLIKAIQSGQPLPIVATGIRLANDVSIMNGEANVNLAGAASAFSGVLSLMSLDAALEQGDTLGAITAGAQTISFAASAYAQFASDSLITTTAEMSAALTDAFGATAGAALGAIGQALPYLSIVNSIAHGDYVGAAVNVAAYCIPYIGWAYAVYSIVSSLFGGHDDIPDPWGNGKYVWNGNSITYQSAGQTGGNEAVSNVMSSVLTVLNNLIEQERLTNPTSALGIIPNRMPTIAYDMSGYRYTDIDPLTGEEKHAYLRFDTSGNPYNATPGSDESYKSITEAMIRSALARSAIAPMWEVQTAKMQTDAGDPKAGLTEEARAGRDGELAPALSGDTQAFRPVTLDLSGNGQIDVISKDASTVSFDVDDSGYLKKTAWIDGGDAFLTLDRDYNGETNTGKEMFSNAAVALGRRGLAGMAWVDANYDYFNKTNTKTIFTCKPFSSQKALHVKNRRTPKEANYGLYHKVA